MYIYIHCIDSRLCYFFVKDGAVHMIQLRSLVSYPLCYNHLLCLRIMRRKRKKKKKVYITDDQKYTVPFLLFVTAKKILLGLCCSIIQSEIKLWEVWRLAVVV